MTESDLRRIAIGIVRDDDRVLLVERVNQEKNATGETLSWVFPGGKVEPGESTRQAAAREVYEESGFEVDPKHTLYEGRHPHFPVHVAYVACSLLSGERDKIPLDPAIKQARFMPIVQIRAFITSTLHEAVAGYLNI